MKNFVENYESLSDEGLITLIKQGKYECLTVLINRYTPTVDYLTVKYGLLSDREDILQEATFSLYSAIGSYDAGKSSFSTFAFTVIKRVIISFIKRNSRKKDIPDELLQPLNDFEIADFNNPEKILLEKESLKSLTDTIKLELSKLELEVLGLFLTGMTYEDIASHLSLSTKAVDNALSRIRKKLK